MISLPQLSKQCGLTVKATRILLDKLRGEGIIKRIGSKYGGRWEVTDQAQTLRPIDEINSRQARSEVEDIAKGEYDWRIDRGRGVDLSR